MVVTTSEVGGLGKKYDQKQVVIGYQVVWASRIIENGELAVSILRAPFVAIHFLITRCKKSAIKK